MKTLTSADPVWEIISRVPDPEVPVLTVVDLGIVRKVETEGEKVRVTITPTYTGCPAMDMIGSNIKKELLNEGYNDVEIKLVLSPAWTTDWLSEEGKKKLKAYGIAPPVGATTDKSVLMDEYSEVQCPRCDSTNTRMVSRFGSTPCKAHYQCKDCMEPFDYFKCH